MRLTARHRHRFPIPSHSSAFADPRKICVNPQPIPFFALRTSVSLIRRSVHATRHFSLTPLFAALPSISRLTPLAAAFTHRDRGVWVASRLSLLTAHYSLPTLPSLCFHHLTNCASEERCASRGSIASRGTCWSSAGLQLPSIDLQTSCFHHLANPFFRNPFVLSSMQIPRGCPTHSFQFCGQRHLETRTHTSVLALK